MLLATTRALAVDALGSELFSTLSAKGIEPIVLSSRAIPSAVAWRRSRRAR